MIWTSSCRPARSSAATTTRPRNSHRSFFSSHCHFGTSFNDILPDTFGSHLKESVNQLSEDWKTNQQSSDLFLNAVLDTNLFQVGRKLFGFLTRTVFKASRGFHAKHNFAFRFRKSRKHVTRTKTTKFRGRNFKRTLHLWHGTESARTRTLWLVRMDVSIS